MDSLAQELCVRISTPAFLFTVTDKVWLFTIAMRDALNTLGYKSYHMLEGAFNPHAFDYWYEALRAKYAGEGKPYERAEFDKLLGNYSVMTSMFFPLMNGELCGPC